MSTTSHQIANSLHLIRQTVTTKTPAKPVEQPTDHIIVVDCSGSMSWDLPKIREQLKKKMPKMLGIKDTISVVWFSGRGQCGTLLEGEPVATLTDLTTVEKAFDRWLNPVGMTGFKDPLEEVVKLSGRLAAKHKDSVQSLFFMTDGADNQCSRQEILKAVGKVATTVTKTTFVEYGHYADRNLLAAMAETAGGTLIYAEGFDRYAPSFEAAMTKKVVGSKRLEVKIAGDAIAGFAYAIHDGDITTYAIEGGKVTVPGYLQEFWYLSPTEVGDIGSPAGSTAEVISKVALTGISQDSEMLAATYAAVSLFSVRMKSDVVFPLLKALGDVRYIEAFSTCFGKQRYSAFMDDAKAATFDAKLRFNKGRNPNLVPKDDAFTVLDVLRLLASSDENRVLLEHPDFQYSAIGRGRIDAGGLLTVEEQAEIQLLTQQMAGEKDAKKVKGISDKIAAITASKPEALKFVGDPIPEGVEISSLTYNEERPNVSLLVSRQGTVDLSARLPEEFKGTKTGKIPPQFRTHIFRNYAIIKDGMVNVDKLPVKVGQETYLKLFEEGVIRKRNPIAQEAEGTCVIDLKALPVINRKMVKEVSAKTLFTKQYQLVKAQAAQKVYNSVKKEKFPKTSAVFSALYGDAGAAWLKDQGIGDGGFSPKAVQAESTDVYMGKELKVSLKGLSSLPSYNEVRKTMADPKKKVNLPTSLMIPHIQAVDAFLASDVYRDAADKDKLFSAWLDGQQKAAVLTCRGLIFELAQIKMAVVVGQVWFSEFASLDETIYQISTPEGVEIKCEVQMREIEIRI